MNPIREMRVHVTCLIKVYDEPESPSNVPVIIINPPPSPEVVLRGGLLGQGLGSRVAIINLWP